MISVLSLDIIKLSPGRYEARCDGYTASPTPHESIAEALRFYGGEIPPGFSQFVDVHYSGVSLGTTAVCRLQPESEALASELVGMSADVSEAMSNKAIDLNALHVEHAAFEAQCTQARHAGQRLLARIRPSSKYFGQSGDANALFPIAITSTREYGVTGGPGGQYRMKDVDLFVVFETNPDPIQITFESEVVSAE